MGLDSIELLMEIEKFFRIQIPDVEAERIYTVQAMIDSVAHHLKITSTNTPLRDKIFLKITESINQLSSAKATIELTDCISKYISPVDKEKWASFQLILGMDIPKPDIVNPGSKKLADKLKHLISWTPLYNWGLITVEQFTDAICANNYLTLVTPDSITSKYEIYISIAGITVDRIGVDYYDISPEKSFTNDLGVD